jgi:hypothetical protein
LPFYRVRVSSRPLWGGGIDLEAIAAAVAAAVGVRILSNLGQVGRIGEIDGKEIAGRGGTLRACRQIRKRREDIALKTAGITAAAATVGATVPTTHKTHSQNRLQRA